MAMLESAIDHAREAGISVSRAKKLLKDMQAQATAASAAARLREVLSSRPCGSGLLKACPWLVDMLALPSPAPCMSGYMSAALPVIHAIVLAALHGLPTGYLPLSLHSFRRWTLVSQA